MNKLSNSSNTEGFSLLPLEVSSIILSQLDLQTLFNTAYSFAGNSFEVGNQVAKSILENRFFKVIENDNSYLRQYFDHLIKSRDVLSEIYEMSTTSKQALFDLELIKINLCFLDFDLYNLDEKIKKNPALINTKALGILEQICSLKNTKLQENLTQDETELKLLIEKGAKVDLSKCLQNFCHVSVIEQILKHKAFKEDAIDLSHVLSVLSYPEEIQSALVALVTDKINFDSSIQTEFENIFKAGRIICSKTISDSNCISLIDKFSPFSLQAAHGFLTLDPLDVSDHVSEVVVNKILDKAAPFLCKSDECHLKMFADHIWNKVVVKNQYSFEVLIKLIDLYTKANIQFDLVKFEKHILYIDKEDFYKNDQLILSLVQNKAKFSLPFLEMAVRNAASPELVFKMYAIFLSQKNERELSQNISTKQQVLNYLFNSKNYKVINGLKELGEYPGWDTVGNAISNENGETLVSLLLDAYENCKYHYEAYSYLLRDAVDHKLSEPLVERILNKAFFVTNSTLEKAKKRQLSEELIQNMQQKLK